jgi:hypothetical protein
MFSHGPGTASRSFIQTEGWRRLAGSGLVGSGGRGDAGFHQTVRRLVRLLRATVPIGTR